jgi:hypothetical protein
MPIRPCCWSSESNSSIVYYETQKATDCGPEGPRQKGKTQEKEFRAMVTNGKMLKDLDSEIRKWLPISLAELCLAVLMVMDDIAIQNANRH